MTYRLPDPTCLRCRRRRSRAINTTETILITWSVKVNRCDGTELMYFRLNFDVEENADCVVQAGDKPVQELIVIQVAD